MENIYPILDEPILEKDELDVEKLTDMMMDAEIDESKTALKCKQCGAVYKKPWTLKAHIKKKHESQPISLKCGQCEEMFTTQKNLNAHIKLLHPILFVCVVRKEVFFDGASLAAHNRTHPKVFTCDECTEVFNDKTSLNNHKKIHFVCNICQRNCESKYKLNRHLKSHKV